MKKHTKEEVKTFIKDGAIAAADAIVGKIPGLDIAWGLSKAYFGASLKLRQERALKWVEMVRDNPEVFTTQLLNDEQFQDGFVYALEKFISERNEYKRQIAKNIFLGFAVSSNKDKYPLEKYLFTLNQLSEADFKVLKDVDISRQDLNYQVYPDNRSLDNIYNLIQAGLLLQDHTARIAGDNRSPFVNISSFGKEFIRFIIDDQYHPKGIK